MQKQRFIQIIHRFVIKLRVNGNSGKAIQFALGRSRTPAEFGPHRDWEWNCKVIWNPGRFQECWIQQSMDCDSDVPSCSWLISSSWHVLLFLQTDFLNVCLLYRIDFLVSRSHNFILFMHYGHSDLFLSPDLSSAAKNFTLLLFLSSTSREKKSGWPRSCFRTAWGDQCSTGDACLEVHLWSNQWAGWVGFHMTLHMLPKAFSSPGELAFQFPWEKNHDFSIEDNTILKALYWSACGHDEWNNVIIYLPYPSPFHIN